MQIRDYSSSYDERKAKREQEQREMLHAWTMVDRAWKPVASKKRIDFDSPEYKKYFKLLKAYFNKYGPKLPDYWILGVAKDPRALREAIGNEFAKLMPPEPYDHSIEELPGASPEDLDAVDEERKRYLEEEEFD